MTTFSTSRSIENRMEDRELLFKWMTGDHIFGMLARINPHRWSRWHTARETVEALEKFQSRHPRDRHGKKPIILQCRRSESEERLETSNSTDAVAVVTLSAVLQADLSAAHTKLVAMRSVGQNLRGFLAAQRKIERDLPRCSAMSTGMDSDLKRRRSDPCIQAEQLVSFHQKLAGLDEPSFLTEMDGYFECWEMLTVDNTVLVEGLPPTYRFQLDHPEASHLAAELRVDETNEKVMLREMQKEQLLLNGRRVDYIQVDDDDAHVLADFCPDLAGVNRYIENVLSGGTTFTRFYQAAEASAPSASELSRRRGCIDLVQRFQEYQLREHRNETWAYRFVREFWDCLSKRRLVLQLLNGLPLPFEPTGHIELSDLRGLKNAALRVLKMEVLPGYIASVRKFNLERASSLQDVTPESINGYYTQSEDLLDQAGLLESEGKHAEAQHARKLSDETRTKADKLRTLRDESADFITLDSDTFSSAVDNLCSSTRSRLTGESWKMLLVLFGRADDPMFVSIGVASECSPIMLTETAAGKMNAESTMVWPIKFASGASRMLEVRMVVSVGDVGDEGGIGDMGMFQDHEFGYCTIQMVSRRQAGQPWNLEAPIQAQLSAVNRYAAEMMVIDGWLPQNNVGALLDAEDVIIDRLLENCCNFDAKDFANDIADAREAKAFQTPRGRAHSVVAVDSSQTEMPLVAVDSSHTEIPLMESLASLNQWLRLKWSGDGTSLSDACGEANHDTIDGQSIFDSDVASMLESTDSEDDVG